VRCRCAIDRIVAHQPTTARHPSRFSVITIQLEKLHGRGLLELDAEVAGDLAQGVIEMREVVDGHVANESAANFIVAGAAVQPSNEEK
jgi:hypothetical protein